MVCFAFDLGVPHENLKDAFDAAQHDLEAALAQADVAQFTKRLTALATALEIEMPRAANDENELPDDVKRAVQLVSHCVSQVVSQLAVLVWILCFCLFATGIAQARPGGGQGFRGGSRSSGSSRSGGGGGGSYSGSRPSYSGSSGGYSSGGEAS
jgi:hypothetical protein